jgi:RimJ/RimL family protein N-acetyltransferase
MEIVTPRLKLRPWKKSDLEPFARINADPQAMEFFPGRLSREQSDELAGKLQSRLEREGYGCWALEVPEGAPFIGFVGLNRPDWEAPFTPCVEIGWRLAGAHWGKGYATEAARAALDFAFGRLNLEEVVAFTVPGNLRSLRVMEKIGMVRDKDGDFDHPKIAEGDPLRRHVLYRIRKGEFHPIQ